MRVPKDLDEVRSVLGGMGQLVTATNWERAAIVATFVDPALGSEPVGGLLTAEQFAKFKIVGLRDPSTIRHYAHAWLTRRPRLRPGASIDPQTLPTGEFPANRTVGNWGSMTPARRESIMAAGQAAGMAKGSKAVDIAANQRALGVAITADDQTQAYVRSILDGLDSYLEYGIDARMDAVLGRLVAVRTEVGRMQVDLTEEQWKRFRPRLDRALTELLSLLADVPETAAALEGGAR